ncbi:MAG: hypothetical protein JNL08_10100 [Planctomycetes bacterium]|nr:hypothetical protein [Planctomycetota bacterium]
MRATVAAAAARSGVPGIAWWCRTLPQRADWPAARDPALPFAVQIGADGLRVLGDGLPLPRDVVAAGTVALGGSEVLWFACRSDGSEDWWLGLDTAAPAAWREQLRALGADVLDEPRQLDAAVVTGHLAGALAEGDPRAELLRLGAAACGQVAWNAWRTPTHLRVRGRSEGGLLLPAALLWLAHDGGHRTVPPLALRAFAARDGDRAEAARQSVRAPGPGTEAALLALLHADDQVAFAAVDALRRLGASAALPQIVGAAGPEAPWTSLAAADALRALWQNADPAVQRSTRAAVQRCASVAVRAVDLDAIAGAAVSPRPAEAAADAAAARLRLLVVLALTAIGLHGLWLRERSRRNAAAV